MYADEQTIAWQAQSIGLADRLSQTYEACEVWRRDPSEHIEELCNANVDKNAHGMRCCGRAGRVHADVACYLRSDCGYSLSSHAALDDRRHRHRHGGVHRHESHGAP